MSRLGSFFPAAVLAGAWLLLPGADTQRRAKLTAPLNSQWETLLGVHGTAQAINEEELRIAGVSDHVARAFASDSIGEFSIYVGYYASQTQGQTIHSPKNCLPGGGWRTLQAGTDTVTTNAGSFVVNRYLVASDHADALVYYWYQGRGRVVANEYRVKWNLLRDAVLTGRTEEALVRLVVPIRPPTTGQRGDALAVAQASKTARAAAAELIGGVATALPARDSDGDR